MVFNFIAWLLIAGVVAFAVVEWFISVVKSLRRIADAMEELAGKAEVIDAD